MPIPLAAAAALVGWAVLGDTLGQHAGEHVHSYEAGGLALSVDQMVWMSNDMSGQGPLASRSQGFAMDPSMMPGFQTAKDNRLRLEVTLRNGTGDTQRYAMSDFRVVATGLSIEWSRGGSAVEIPVDTSGKPQPHTH